jgi:hypothetical protein
VLLVSKVKHFSECTSINNRLAFRLRVRVNLLLILSMHAYGRYRYALKINSHKRRATCIAIVASHQTLPFTQTKNFTRGRETPGARLHTVIQDSFPRPSSSPDHAQISTSADGRNVGILDHSNQGQQGQTCMASWHPSPVTTRQPSMDD